LEGNLNGNYQQMQFLRIAPWGEIDQVPLPKLRRGYHWQMHQVQEAWHKILLQKVRLHWPVKNRGLFFISAKI